MIGRRLSILLAMSGAMVWTVSPVTAAEFSVSQKGHLFTPNELTVKVGDTVIFVNDDNGTHNVFSISDGNAFDLKAQRPGATTNVSFAKAGSVDVRCAIHPSMKMVIKVQ